jgi:haloalkane dehalogenase
MTASPQEENEIHSGVLRTPDECFADIADFPYDPNYIEIDRLRIHYLDEGPTDGTPILLMHGEPSWCYLYRKMIPRLVEAGCRCVAPDLVGFGRSDKLAAREDYSYAFHVDMMNKFLRVIDLSNTTLFAQDWGSLIGIRVLIDNQDRFRRLIVANGGLPTGDHGVSDGFKEWLDYSQNVENFHVGGIIKGGCADGLSPEAIAAYNAPFPNDAYKEAARIFPALVPVTPDNPESQANRDGWEALRNWNGKVLTLFSDQDPVTRGGAKPFQKLLPGAQGQPHETIRDAGHFLQEDKGEEIAEKIVAWLT